MKDGLNIGELGRRTGTNVETFRYYERIGILEPPARTAAGYRSYRADDVQRLSFVRRARAGLLPRRNSGASGSRRRQDPRLRGRGPDRAPPSQRRRSQDRPASGASARASANHRAMPRRHDRRLPHSRRPLGAQPGRGTGRRGLNPAHEPQRNANSSWWNRVSTSTPWRARSLRSAAPNAGGPQNQKLAWRQ